jgi:hypothetical protein
MLSASLQQSNVPNFFAETGFNDEQSDWLTGRSARVMENLQIINNNTFTWAGPSGVLGFTGQRGKFI